MERIQHLIEKLADQSRRGDSTAQLLPTVQLLHQELLLQQGEHKLNSAKVAVVMPGMNALPPDEAFAPEEQKPSPALETLNVIPPTPAEAQPQPSRQVLPIIPDADKRFIPSEPAVVPAVASPLQNEQGTGKGAPTEGEPQRFKHYALQKPLFETYVTAATPEREPMPGIHAPYDRAEPSPVLMQHGTVEKEVHEVLAEKKESLNERLSQQRQELGAVLKEAPIHDLRKGIGVNDKFLFINELFRADEDMYQRSIKTINEFRILPEAEYWINRELKVKLGWNDAKDTVQHFYAIVRRRFS